MIEWMSEWVSEWVGGLVSDRQIGIRIFDSSETHWFTQWFTNANYFPNKALIV